MKLKKDKDQGTDDEDDRDTEDEILEDPVDPAPEEGVVQGLRRSKRLQPPEEIEEESEPVELDEDDDGSGYAPLRYFGKAAMESGILEQGAVSSSQEVVFDLENSTAPVLCNVIQIPHGLKAAMRSPEWPKWHEAMKTQ